MSHNAHISEVADLCKSTNSSCIDRCTVSRCFLQHRGVRQGLHGGVDFDSSKFEQANSTLRVACDRAWVLVAGVSHTLHRDSMCLCQHYSMLQIIADLA